MSVATKIAKRFVFDRKSLDAAGSRSRGFVSFISSISVFGLSLGVTALLVVTSVVNGFEREMKSVLTAFHGHILIFSKAEPISDPLKMAAEIRAENPGVTAVSPYFFIEAMLSSPKGVVGTIVEGIDLDTIDSVSRVRDKMIEGTLPEKSDDSAIAIGSEIARKLKVSVGDSIVLTIPFMGGANSAPKVKKLKVVGIAKLGMYDYDSKYSMMEISRVQELVGVKNQANAFKILTVEMTKSNLITNALNDRYVYPIRARDWSSLNRNLFYAIELEKIVIGIILMAIVLVASFNIISTLMMLVHDKKKQISMLKALGLSPSKTLSIFLFVGLGMAVSGVVLGLGLARAMVEFLKFNSIIDLPADVYGLARLPVEIRVHEWVAICIFVILLALLSTFWPSLRISRQSPVEGIRYE